eukprot:46963-Eustigmatos_ZCMA.PRE.1
MITAQQSKEISGIFYGDSHLMRNVNILFQRTKDAGIKVTLRQLRDWYQNQAVVQIFRRLPKITHVPIQ